MMSMAGQTVALDEKSAELFELMALGLQAEENV
jgi:hypothetical protein